MNARAQMLNFHFGSIFNLRYIVGFLSYKHDSKNKNDQQTLIISNLIIFWRARVHFTKLLQKWYFFISSKNAATCLEISACASARPRTYWAPIDAHAKTKHFSYLHRPHNFKIHASLHMQSFEKFFKNGPPCTFEPPWTQHDSSCKIIFLISIDLTSLWYPECSTCKFPQNRTGMYFFQKILKIKLYMFPMKNPILGIENPCLERLF